MMQPFSPQAAEAVVMVRPHFFASNPDTLPDNAFQTVSAGSCTQAISAAAYEEVTAHGPGARGGWRAGGFVRR